MSYTETKTIEIPELVQLGLIANALERLANKFCNPPRPGKPTLQVISQVQIGGASMLKFNVNLPPFDDANRNDNDVTVRHLSVTVGSGEPINVDAGPSDATLENDLFVGNAGDVVSLSLIDADASGNASTPSTASVTLTDTIAPPTPGTLNLNVTGQV